MAFFKRLTQQDNERLDGGVKKTRQTWFGRIATLFQHSQFDDGFWDELEELLISADIGLQTTELLIQRTRKNVLDMDVTEPEDAKNILKTEMVRLLPGYTKLDSSDDENSPLIILVVGVNGVGKTTSVAKLAQLYKANGRDVIMGAADTFRAAAVEQLKSWGDRLQIDVIAHKQGADPGAVVFDTLNAARSRKCDVVLIDTAGRLHTKFNLMQELQKIYRIIERQENCNSVLVILVLDATTGQNGVLQAKTFTDAVNCDGVFLAKLDGTAKGGVVLAIAHELKLPVMFIGTGEQSYDVAAFEPCDFVERLFATSGPT